MTSTDPPYLVALRAVAAWLDTVDAPARVIGGLAVIVHGHLRTTFDIDATISAADVDPKRLIGSAADFGFKPRHPDPLTFARQTQMLLLTHEATGVQIDVSLAWLPFELDALTRRAEVVFEGLTLRVCDPGDLIVYKLVAARPRDLDDAKQIALRHWQTLDRDRILNTAREFDVLLEDDRSRAQMWREIANAASGGGSR